MPLQRDCIAAPGAAMHGAPHGTERDLVPTDTSIVAVGQMQPQ
jgi:hypothetical protein